MNISSDISFSPESNSSNSSDCLFSNDTEVETDLIMFTVGYTISVLMSLPINCYVIWLVVKGTGNGLAAEFFTFNLSVCNIISSGEVIVVYLAFCQIPWIALGFLDGLSLIGYHLFECLICVERYLAVVYPLTFLKYKSLRYRLICSAVAWGTTFVFGGFNVIILSLDKDVYFIVLITLFLVFLSIQLFCCLAVLRALKQSGPGERGREREEENHMKRRAFHLILLATVSTIIIHSPNIILFPLMTSVGNVMIIFVDQICFILAGLVQPVLFLYRVGKLNLIKCQ